MFFLNTFYSVIFQKLLTYNIRAKLLFFSTGTIIFSLLKKKKSYVFISHKESEDVFAVFILNSQHETLSTFNSNFRSSLPTSLIPTNSAISRRLGGSVG